MLQKNPLLPPLPTSASQAVTMRLPAGVVAAPSGRPLVAAEDFDGTGILTGMDPSASRYWWMPELYGPEQAVSSHAALPQAASSQATSRLAGSPPAAA
jgi:hypothetical protein